MKMVSRLGPAQWRYVHQRQPDGIVERKPNGTAVHNGQTHPLDGYEWSGLYENENDTGKVVVQFLARLSGTRVYRFWTLDPVHQIAISRIPRGAA